MTEPQDLLVAAILDAREAYAVFENYSTAELQRLQRVHQNDQARATTPEGIAFGGGRLALIAAVLAQRRKGVSHQAKRHVEVDPKD